MNDRRVSNPDLEIDHAPANGRREGFDEPATAYHQRNGFNNGNVSPRTNNCPPTVVNASHVLNHAPQREIVNETGVSFDRPKYIQYAIRVSRLKTLKNWPESHFLKSSELSDAGFFYCENGDTVVCYYCGLALNAWERGDRPWTEHARWSPNCTHILNMIGPNFIKETLECDGDVKKIKGLNWTVRSRDTTAIKEGRSGHNRITGSRLTSYCEVFTGFPVFSCWGTDSPDPNMNHHNQPDIDYPLPQTHNDGVFSKLPTVSGRYFGFRRRTDHDFTTIDKP